MKQLSCAQKEFLRALKCFHYFLAGTAVTMRSKGNRDFADVLELCDSRLLVERVSVSNSMFGVFGKDRISVRISDDSETAFGQGISYATAAVLSDTFFKTSTGKLYEVQIRKHIERFLLRTEELELRGGNARWQQKEKSENRMN